MSFTFNPNFSGGTPPCNLSRFDKQKIYIEVWSFDFDQNKHTKFGSTIRKTEADYDANGAISIDIPKLGTFYLDIEIIKDCNDCCGSASTNPDKCDGEDLGKPQWKYKTSPSQWQPSSIVPVDFNTCKCEC